MPHFLDDAPFPHFRKFTMDDLADYGPIYRSLYAPHYNVAPANLMAVLDIDHQLEIAKLDEAIIFRYNNLYDDDRLNHTILEPDVSEAHVRAIYDLYPDRHDILIREEPATLTRSLANSPAVVLNDNVDGREYILSTKAQAELDGGTLYRRRREAHYFEKKYGVPSVRYIESSSAEDRDLLATLTERWKASIHDTTTSSGREKDVIRFTLQHFNELDRQALILYLDAKPISFVIFSVYGDTAIGSHLKVDYSYEYIFNYTIHRFAQELLKRGIPYLNIEDDLGIEGLRNHKAQLHPIRTLDKVDIALKRPEAQ